MEELLQRLERRIKELVDQHDRLQKTNLQLSNKKITLARECDTLMLRQQKTIAKIESLVAKLKIIEKQL